MKILKQFEQNIFIEILKFLNYNANHTIRQVTRAPVPHRDPSDGRPDGVNIPACNRMSHAYIEIANLNLDLLTNHNPQISAREVLSKIDKIKELYSLVEHIIIIDLSTTLIERARQ